MPNGEVGVPMSVQKRNFEVWRRPDDSDRKVICGAGGAFDAAVTWVADDGFVVLPLTLLSPGLWRAEYYNMETRRGGRCYVRECKG